MKAMEQIFQHYLLDTPLQEEHIKFVDNCQQWAML